MVTHTPYGNVNLDSKEIRSFYEIESYLSYKFDHVYANMFFEEMTDLEHKKHLL